MRGRKKVEKVMEENVMDMKQPKIDAVDYWKWKNSINVMWLSTEKEKLSNSEATIFRRDAEIATLKMNLHLLTKVEEAKKASQKAKDSYELLKKEIEDKLGMSLENKGINEMTLEVSDLGSDSSGKK